MRLKTGNQSFLAGCLLSLLSITHPVHAQVNADGTIDTGDKFANAKLKVDESPEVTAQRLQWWSDARFGMFIHWGVYAQDGCFWNGKDGRSEHMMRNLQIPIKEYTKIAAVFNPTQFNADDWVTIAKNAGMKYMVITSKHHDGFAMFNSASNDFNILAQTPWKHDPMKELAEACKKQGLKFGVYYSLGRDWHDPDGNSIGGNRSNTWDYPEEGKKDFTKYFNRKVKPQVAELMKQYRPAIMWFDTPELISADQSRELIKLIRDIDPACIVNQRVGNRLGDYAVKEQSIPASGQPQPWETCMTLNGAWGYHKNDEKWKTPDSLVHSLIDIASKGGNFLLNVGPTGEGIISQPSVERLQEVGNWMKKNGEAIYGTKGSPVGKLSWGRCTSKEEKGNTILYLSIFDWPANGKLFIPNISNKVVAASMLAGGRAVKTNSTANGITLELPGDYKADKYATVVKVQLKGAVAKN